MKKNESSQKAPVTAPTGPHAQHAGTIFVGDLSLFSTENDLKALFAPYNVKDVKIIKCRNSEKKSHLLYGFVSLSSADLCALAISHLNGRVLKGRPLRLGWAAHKCAKGPTSSQLRSQNNVHVRFETKPSPTSIKDGQRGNGEVVTEEFLLKILQDWVVYVSDVSIKESIVDVKTLAQRGFGFISFQEGSSHIAFACASAFGTQEFHVGECTVTVTISPSRNLLSKMEMGLKVHHHHQQQQQQQQQQPILPVQTHLPQSPAHFEHEALVASPLESHLCYNTQHLQQHPHWFPQNFSPECVSGQAAWDGVYPPLSPPFHLGNSMVPIPSMQPYLHMIPMPTNLITNTPTPLHSCQSLTSHFRLDEDHQTSYIDQVCVDDGTDKTIPVDDILVHSHPQQSFNTFKSLFLNNQHQFRFQPSHTRASIHH